MSRWLPALPAHELPPGAVKVKKLEGRPVALFHLEEGGLFAVDNRCPHEGYPLSQGAVSGCTLTCCWHNYKFDLRDGSCLKGDEDVASFPVRIVDGTVEIELVEADPEEERARLLASLHTALWEARTGQAARDAVRLLQLGMAEAELAAWVAAWDGRHCEWGASHALAVAWDALLQAPRFPGPRFVAHLVQAMELASEAHVRRPARSVPEPVDPGEDPVAAGLRFVALVEEEDSDGAIALVLGALGQGWGRAELEPWLWSAVCQHHLSFGHRLIYQSKVWDLLDAAEEAAPGASARLAPDILSGHVLGVVAGTREEVLPSWTAFRRRLEGVELGSTWNRVGRDPSWSGQVAVAHALTGGSVAEAFEAVQGALEAGAPLQALVDALVLAASQRLLRFDPDIDLRADVQDGWLSVTHCLTAAEALRRAVDRHAGPELLRLVHFVARMIHHHRVLDLSEAPALPAPQAGSLEDLDAALAGQDAPRAQALAGALLARDAEALHRHLVDRALLDAYTVPIVSAHVLKTAWAAAEEHRRTGEVAPVLGVVRWLASPSRQRWTGRTVGEALAFVLEGKVPRVLAP